MAKTKYNVIVYHDTAANWATDTTVYGDNIFMYATDTGVMKKGDGAKAYANLGSIGSVATWGAITNQPTVIAAGATAAAAWAVIDDAAIGTTATTAAAGNHDHAVVADVDSGLAEAANIQALAIALSARIKALEDAP